MDSHKVTWIHHFILQSKPFWILARAVKEFVQEEGQGEENRGALWLHIACVLVLHFVRSL